MQGHRETALPGFALEIELVLPAQHAVRLVHGLLGFVPTLVRG
jgi:hypothetical protein